MRPLKAPPIGIHLQDRDLAVLRSLLESRVLTTRHLCALHFESRPDATKLRLRNLRLSGLIDYRPRELFERAIYFLTSVGLRVLRDRGVLQQYPALGLPAFERRARVSEITLRHELEVIDVKAAVYTALRRTTFTALEFTTWPLLNQFNNPRSRSMELGELVKPDGFLRVSGTRKDGEGHHHSFFFEIDRSTEQQSILVTRANQYLAHYRSGGFALRNGASPDERHKHPFRALYVLQNAERRNNTIEGLIQNSPPILTHVWLTTRAEVLTNPLGPIWIRPIDYRDALARATFNPIRRAWRAEYRRQPSRDEFVERNVPKHALLPREFSNESSSPLAA